MGPALMIGQIKVVEIEGTKMVSAVIRRAEVFFTTDGSHCIVKFAKIAKHILSVHFPIQC